MSRMNLAALAALAHVLFYVVLAVIGSLCNSQVFTNTVPKFLTSESGFLSVFWTFSVLYLSLLAAANIYQFRVFFSSSGASGT